MIFGKYSGYKYMATGNGEIEGKIPMKNWPKWLCEALAMFCCWIIANKITFLFVFLCSENEENIIFLFFASINLTKINISAQIFWLSTDDLFLVIRDMHVGWLFISDPFVSFCLSNKKLIKLAEHKLNEDVAKR